MFAATILKCMMLAQGELLILETPINEYAMATIETNHHDFYFQGTVIEGKMNSVIIGYPKLGIDTNAFSARDFSMQSLATHLNIKDLHASLECEIL